MAKTSDNEDAKCQSLGKQIFEVATKSKCQNSSKIQPNSQNMFKVSHKKTKNVIELHAFILYFYCLLNFWLFLIVYNFKAIEVYYIMRSFSIYI